MSLNAILAGAAAIAAIVVAVILIGGGDGDDGTSDGQQTDDDFIVQMSAHHEQAIEMAAMAQERGEHAEVKQLAKAIDSAQRGEIQRMGSIHERMFGEGADHGGHHGTLGLSETEMGMHGDMAALESAKPFDRAFIESMIEHHQGAIRMAQIELEQGEDDELAAIAEAIIAAQTAEIEQMNQWHEQWFGAPAPAGETPSEGEVPSHGMMGH